MAELIDQHGQMVFATAYRILGNPDDADDALQEVFLKMLGGWNGRLWPDAVRNWGGYLRVAAIRSAVDLLHRRRKRNRCELPLQEGLTDSASPNPHHAAMERERADQLRWALRALPKREAHVVALRYFEDQSYEQIADQMGLSVRKVGVLLFRARGRLRKLLAPFFGDDVRPDLCPAAIRPAREGEEQCR